MQLIKGFSPLNTGLLFLPLIGCILISSNASSIVLLPRAGPRALIASGMLLGVIGMIYLTRLTVTSSYLSGVLPALLVMGLGFGMIFAPAINTATAGVRREDSGVASALVNTMQQVGGSIGTSALSTIALTARPATWSLTIPARWRRRSRPSTATRWPSRYRRGCSGWASSWRSPCCRPAAGSRNSGAKQRPPHPPRPWNPLPRRNRPLRGHGAACAAQGTRLRAGQGTRLCGRYGTRLRDALRDAGDPRGAAVLLAGDQA